MNQIYIFFGPSGSGKTAQAKRLQSQMGFQYLSWGDISREIEAGKGIHKEYQELVKEIHLRHLPFPKGFVTDILKAELINITNVKNIKIIIDGYPKRLEEALELESLLSELNLDLTAVIRFNVDLSTYLIRQTNKRESSIFTQEELVHHYDRYMSESMEAFNKLAPQAKYAFDLNASDDETQVFASLVSKLNSKSTNKYHLYAKAATTKLQTEFGEFDFTAFQNKVSYETHLVLSIGDIKGKRHVPTRVHSSCITGDIFHSHRCDCMQQLHYALKHIANNKSGILIYLFQEGRGINIINKIKAYELQQGGRDTVEANTDLGLPPELRNYSAVKDILDEMGVASIDLMTNNPDKIAKLQDVGVVVENRIPTIIQSSLHNQSYLKTKRDKMQHILN
jgi:GTP cyclohydrolase II